MTFGEFLRAQGLVPRTIAPDGRWRRCPTVDKPKRRNGSYKLAPDGCIGWAQNWATQAEPVVWRADGEAPPASYDPGRMRSAWAAERGKRRQATTAARRFYAECPPLRGGHPYLEAHELDVRGCYGLRVDKGGWLVVPAYRRGRLVSVQRIAPDGTKRFWPGASVRGACYLVERRHATITVYCEGLATGLAIYAAAPLTRIVVAFNAGNLARVLEPRAGLAVVAADNDHETEERTGANPGLDAARAAAAALGCGVAAPDGLEAGASDWADWRMAAVRTRLEAWNRPPHQTDAAVRRAVDAEIAAAIQRNAMFVSPTHGGR